MSESRLWISYDTTPMQRDGLAVWKICAHMHDGEKRNVAEEVMYSAAPRGTEEYRFTMEWLTVKIQRKMDRYVAERA